MEHTQQQQDMIQQNLALMRAQGKREQVLIEDGTMSTLGYVNKSEVTVSQHDKLYA